MASSTMINLRGITPLASAAAILPAHTLRFNIPGVPGFEPSSASVEPTIDSSIIADSDDDKVVHGVLYKLSEEDFATICSTEGVPFAYSLHRCRVIPYTGDGVRAGQDALQKEEKEDETDEIRDTNNRQLAPNDIKQSSASKNSKRWGVSAFTLRAARKEWQQNPKDIPPSQAYLNVLLQGAREFALDESYIQKLENVKVGRTWIGNGMAEQMLRMAEQRNKRW